MKIFINENLSKLIANKYVYFDNDFLSELYHNAEVLTEVLTVFQKNPLILDPLTEFEFLRSVFLPEQLNLKKAFIKQDIFTIATLHQEIFKKLNDNALLLSQIYAHQNSPKVSFVDLHIAARIMYSYKISVLVTGNKKDFPSCLFDILSVISIEQIDGTMKPYYVLQFDNKKFTNCLNDFEKLNKKSKESD